ncbi:hypothetical protein JCM5353_006261 [Sporobolomyces roseus]
MIAFLALRWQPSIKDDVRYWLSGDMLAWTANLLPSLMTSEDKRLFLVYANGVFPTWDQLSEASSIEAGWRGVYLFAGTISDWFKTNMKRVGEMVIKVGKAGKPGGVARALSALKDAETTFFKELFGPSFVNSMVFPNGNSNDFYFRGVALINVSEVVGPNGVKLGSTQLSSLSYAFEVMVVAAFEGAKELTDKKLHILKPLNPKVHPGNTNPGGTGGKEGEQQRDDNLKDLAARRKAKEGVISKYEDFMDVLCGSGIGVSYRRRDGSDLIELDQEGAPNRIKIPGEHYQTMPLELQVNRLTATNRPDDGAIGLMAIYQYKEEVGIFFSFEGGKSIVQPQLQTVTEGSPFLPASQQALYRIMEDVERFLGTVAPREEDSDSNSDG